MDVIYYVALPFVTADDGVAAGEAVECLSTNRHARRSGQRGKLGDAHRLGPERASQCHHDGRRDEVRDGEQRPNRPRASAGDARDEHLQVRQHSSVGSRCR